MHRICVIEMPHETLTVAVNGRCQQNSTWRTCSCWKGHHYILPHHDFIVLAIHTAAGVSWDWLLLGRQHSSILQLILSFINQALYMCLFVLHLLPESATSQDAPQFSTGRSDYHYPYKGGSLQWGVAWKNRVYLGTSLRRAFSAMLTIKNLHNIFIVGRQDDEPKFTWNNLPSVSLIVNFLFLSPSCFPGRKVSL